MASTTTPRDASDAGASERVERRVEAFLDAGRALVGIAVHSVNAAPVEITVTQYRLLAVLGADGPLAVTEAARQLGVVQSTATRHCDRLQRLGLLRRRRSTDDRRVVLVALTDGGRELVDLVTELRRSDIRRVLAAMGDRAAARALRAMTDFNTAAGSIGELPWLRADW